MHQTGNSNKTYNNTQRKKFPQPINYRQLQVLYFHMDYGAPEVNISSLNSTEKPNYIILSDPRKSKREENEVEGSFLCHCVILGKIKPF